jgi:hypothetical protein
VLRCIQSSCRYASNRIWRGSTPGKTQIFSVLMFNQRLGLYTTWMRAVLPTFLRHMVPPCSGSKFTCGARGGYVFVKMVIITAALRPAHKAHPYRHDIELCKDSWPYFDVQQGAWCLLLPRTGVRRVAWCKGSCKNSKSRPLVYNNRLTDADIHE